MKRLVGLALSALFLLPALSSPSAGSSQSAGNSSVQMGHPSTVVIGITETEFKVRRCVESIARQGFDGFAMPVGAFLAVRGLSAGLPVPSNMSFYSSSCRWTGTRYVIGSSPVEAPRDSAWVVVSFLYGRSILLEWKTGSTYDEARF